ncbi:MAG: DNA-3-methyladenine glycosylase I, partial [Pseudonocardiales bacterium]|nr:DNA-3-methyladenine glycosylase I [Pseudonocardiales bacterium]
MAATSAPGCGPSPASVGSGSSTRWRSSNGIRRGAASSGTPARSCAATACSWLCPTDPIAPASSGPSWSTCRWAPSVCWAGGPRCPPSGGGSRARCGRWRASARRSTAPVGEPVDDSRPDGRSRCGWATAAPEYIAYHDDEWGHQLHGVAALFERITLEGFQSGLSWLIILRKRPAFRAAFAGFDPAAVARFGDADVTRLLGDAGIVRNRSK